MKTTDSPLQEFLSDLEKRTSGELRTDQYSKVLYSTDASIYQVMPYGVFFPRSQEEVHAAVELAAKFQIPILPRTAGSSLVGQAVNEALIIDFTRHLDQILEINKEEHWVRVQPGIVLDELNMALKPLGLHFGPDPASSNRAAMGGIVANNSTGAHSILYGMTADHVLETDVVLSDGSLATFGPQEQKAIENRHTQRDLEGRIYQAIWEIVQTKADIIRARTPLHWRRCGGYNLDRLVDGPSFKIAQDVRFNLAKLICGSEGTLAVMTDIKLNLVPVPSKTGLAILHFEDLYTALRSVPAILEVEPSAVELLDNLALTMCRSVPEYARLLSTFIAGSPNCVLITEFYGESEAELTAKIDRLQTHLDKLKIGAQTNPILSPAHQNNVWTVRKAGLGLLMSIKGDHKPVPFIEDAAVPVEHLADYVTQIEAFCNARGIKVAYYAHASAGCLHIRPSVNTKDAEEIAKMPEISHFTLDLLKGYGGALSSEHGDGRARSWLNEQFFGKELFDLFRQVKVAFDPISLLNPGNIVDGGPMDQNLRFGSDYEPVALEEHLDFREDLGFNRAVEMCNGAAICRKRTTGTMCPSFMVTRDEEHSTRGRANALRAAISGQLAVEELTSPRMYKVMDLCVECKACKAECPSSVDMAKIKFEFLAHYYETHPVSRRTKLFADIARWSRLSSGRLAPLINLGLKNPILRWGLQQYAGIDRTRRLPEFARQPFNVWFNRRPYSLRPTNPTGGKKRKVILFNDTFNTYNYPHVARSAAELLEAAGFVVGLPGHKCCGRPMISKGLVKEARAAAKDTVQRLAPFARAGIPIVGLEPSCILSLRDEYLYLLPDNPDVHIVADNTYTFEEFFTELAASGDLHLRFTDQPKRLLLHGHCHQKALIGTGPTEKAITLPANYEVEVVDSGCCGMAGAFGYEAEHYHVSMAMAERRLLPAVRTASADTIVVAPGVSCRQQILHGTGRNAAHPAEVLREALILL